MTKPPAQREKPLETGAPPPPQMNPATSCVGCVYYLLDVSVCRRYPPTVMDTGRSDVTGNRIYDSAFPRLQPYGWCGEHKRVGSK